MLYLAGVEAAVREAESGDDVSEGGGDVAPAAGPLHIVNRRLGVHLNTD